MQRAYTTARPTVATISAVVACLLVGCPVPPPPVSPRPAPAEADCAAVCEHWRALDCREADPSPSGEPCEVLCEIMRDTWDTACMAAVDRCEALGEC